MSWQTDPAQDADDHDDARVAEIIREGVDDLLAGRRAEYHEFYLMDLDEDVDLLPEALRLLARLTSERGQISSALGSAMQFLDRMHAEITLRVQVQAEAAIRAAWAQSWEP